MQLQKKHGKYKIAMSSQLRSLSLFILEDGHNEENDNALQLLLLVLRLVHLGKLVLLKPV
jgi:phosphoribosylpyrophosphate synthetase